MRVTGESLLTYEYVGEVRAAAGEWIKLVAKIAGPVSAASFNLLDVAGNQVSSVILADNGRGGDVSADDGLYTGYIQADITGDYRLQLYGTTGSGSEFVRTDPRLIRVRNVSVTAPKPVTLIPGSTHTFTF